MDGIRISGSSSQTCVSSRKGPKYDGVNSDQPSASVGLPAPEASVEDLLIRMPRRGRFAVPRQRAFRQRQFIGIRYHVRVQAVTDVRQHRRKELIIVAALDGRPAADRTAIVCRVGMVLDWRAELHPRRDHKDSRPPEDALEDAAHGRICRRGIAARTVAAVRPRPDRGAPRDLHGNRITLMICHIFTSKQKIFPYIFVCFA